MQFSPPISDGARPACPVFTSSPRRQRSLHSGIIYNGKKFRPYEKLPDNFLSNGTMCFQKWKRSCQYFPSRMCAWQKRKWAIVNYFQICSKTWWLPVTIGQQEDFSFKIPLKNNTKLLFEKYTNFKFIKFSCSISFYHSSFSIYFLFFAYHT